MSPLGLIRSKSETAKQSVVWVEFECFCIIIRSTSEERVDLSVFVSSSDQNVKKRGRQVVNSGLSSADWVTVIV